ncbi:DUF1289 domain-containing protein [Marinospirillum perlucidum]|uniref:DUF1289 domain-containing protein n=1 Tax=Marinospirillum perlucidum TaxID=1982602 RepID=UPI000DF2C8D1|nr:DUF1289 domain-containing protein [Marinospirillum perlucidum]
MKSPCVGFCSTTFGDPVCRGCKRTREEVDAWNQLTSEQQRQVWQRLWQQAQEVVSRYLRVEDADLLHQQLLRRAIRHHPDAPPEAWVLDLLRVGSEKIQDLQAYGIQRTPQAGDKSPAALFNQLTQELL